MKGLADDQICERCYLDRVRGANHRNAAQNKVSAVANEDLIAKLKKAATPLNVAAEIANDDPADEEKPEEDLVTDLHKKIETLC